MAEKVLVLYHGGCDDGFGGALAAWLALGETAEYVGLEFGKPAPDVKGRDVVMIDFFPYGAAWARSCGARSLSILDHHKTAAVGMAELCGLPEVGEFFQSFRPPEGVPPGKIVYDVNRSGATIAWEHFHPGKPVPDFFLYLEDRDLFRNSLPGNEAFTMALRSWDQLFPLWKLLMEAGPANLIAEGRSINRFYERKCREVAATHRMTRVEVAPGVSHLVPVVNCPWFMGSDVCHQLAEGFPFALYWYTRGEDVCWGARSIEGGLDVSEVAKAYGGGGHKHAAGWVVKGGFAGTELRLPEKAS